MKSSSSATVDKAAKLGSSTGSSIGKKSNGGQVLGKEVELGNLICKFNAKDQADVCLRTTEAIADFVGVECGRDMRMLVKKSNEKIFTEPLPPRAATDTKVPAPGRLEKHRTELMICHKDMKACAEQKTKVFVVILGQCSSEVKNKLVNNVGFETLEDNDDVVGPLKMLKEMAFSTSGVQHPCWTLQNVLRHLTAINKGPSESVPNYHKRFLTAAEVIEAQWGQFCPVKLTTGAGLVNKKTAHDNVLSMIFLAGADKKRCGVMLEELNNSHLAKKDNHPTSVEDAVMLLSHCQGHQCGVRNVMDDNTGLETNFAQLNRMSKLCCYECNELGHVRTVCPKLKKNSHFQNEEGDDSARTSTLRGWAS